jgi:outer membrane protein TolC
LNNIPSFEIDLAKAQNEAKENRSDYINYELEKNASKIEMKRAAANRHITGILSASYGLNQTGSNFSDVYDNPLNSQQVSFSFNMPLINWGKARYDYKSAQNAYESKQASVTNQEQNMDLDIISKVMEIKQLRSSLFISAKADTIAQKRYEVSKNRYLIGKIDITNLTIAQNEKDEALVNYVRKIQNFWIAYYQLRRITLYDFEKNQKIS